MTLMKQTLTFFLLTLSENIAYDWSATSIDFVIGIVGGHIENDHSTLTCHIDPQVDPLIEIGLYPQNEICLVTSC